MAQWRPYTFEEDRWWSTVEVEFTVDGLGCRKRRLLLDTSIAKSYIFKSTLSNVVAGKKEYPFAYYHQDGITFTGSINMHHIPNPIHWNDDVRIDFTLLDDNGMLVGGGAQTSVHNIRQHEYFMLCLGAIPRKKRMPILSRENHDILRDYAMESWMADSAFDYEKRTRRRYLNIDGVLGVESWSKFQLNSPIVHMLTKKQGIKWTLLGTILTIKNK